jgi:hypothetical protein
MGVGDAESAQHGEEIHAMRTEAEKSVQDVDSEVVRVRYGHPAAIEHNQGGRRCRETIV